MNKDTIHERIISDPEICHGSPCISGTRIPVSLVVSLIAEGVTSDEIITDYPSLTNEDIKAAIKYAANLCELQSHTS